MKIAAIISAHLSAPQQLSLTRIGTERGQPTKTVGSGNSFCCKGFFTNRIINFEVLSADHANGEAGISIIAARYAASRAERDLDLHLARLRARMVLVMLSGKGAEPGSRRRYHLASPAEA